MFDLIEDSGFSCLFLHSIYYGMFFLVAVCQELWPQTDMY